MFLTNSEAKCFRRTFFSLEIFYASLGTILKVLALWVITCSKSTIKNRYLPTEYTRPVFTCSKPKMTD